MFKRHNVVIVEGIIGVGKSTVSRELAKALGDDTLCLMEPDEGNDANPYLADFYGDPSRWALTMQTHLLSARYAMQELAQWHVLAGEGHAVLDRSFYGDTCFARLQLARGTLTDKEFSTYRSMYHHMTAHVLLPNVCVRLLVSPEVAAARIQQRMEERDGRKCESVIDLEYLQALDREVTLMTDVLKGQGVTVLDVPWDVERASASARADAVNGLAARINAVVPQDSFLDLHRRTP